MSGIKKSNEYAQEFPNYTGTPKAVIAAIALSLAQRIVDSGQEPADVIREEWTALYDNGVVPQKPPATKGGSL